MENSHEIKTTIYLALMMLASTLLSLCFFLHQSLRLDEAQSLWQTSRSAVGIITLVSQDVHVPLYHELLHAWRLFFGSSVPAARLLSMLFYLLGIPALYALGRLAYDRQIGLYAALLFSISPFMNWYGNEVRMYSLFTLLVICNQYCFVRLFKRMGDTHQGATWVGYMATALVGIFVHYFFFLNLLAQAAFYFLHADLFPARALRRFIIAAALVTAAFLPWVWFVHLQGQAQNQTPLLSIPTTINLFNTFAQFLFGFQSDAVNTFFLSLWPLTIIFAFLALRRGRLHSPVTEYLLLSAFLSVLIAFAISFITPVFVSRYLIFTVPALYLLLGNLFDSYAPQVGRFARSFVVLVMLVTLGVEIVSAATPVKEDYRDAATFIAQNATAQDVVALSAPFTIYPIEYYYRGQAPITTIPLWNRYAYGPIPPFSAEKLPAQVDSITADHQNVWLLLSYDQGYEQQVKAYFDTHYQRLLAITFSHDLTLYVYKIRYDTVRSQASAAVFAACMLPPKSDA